MIILGEKFYYMHNHQEANFDLSEISTMLVQPAHVQVVDEYTLEIVSEDEIFVVIVVIDDETFAATKPLTSEKKAMAVATVLQKKLKRMYGLK
jgi:hypothetical protein